METRHSLLDGHDYVLDVGQVVSHVHGFDVLGGGLKFGPPVDLNAHVLLDDIGVGIADNNHGAFLDEVELLVSGNQLDAAKLVSNEALGDAVHRTAVVPLALADDFDGLDSEMHVDAGAGLELVHLDEHGFAESGFSQCGGNLGLLGCSFDHYLT